jgi:hypothetical protein
MSQREDLKRAAQLGLGPPPEHKPSLAERYLGKWQENFAQRQPFSSALASLGREAVKDVRGTMNEVFFGHGEHASEPGTPLNPTMQIITSEIRGTQPEKSLHRELDIELDR